MKTVSKLIFFLLISTCCLLFSSCDVDHCGVYTFNNSSDYKLSLFVFREAKVVTEESFDSIIPASSYELEKRPCAFGYPNLPFSIGIPLDSIVLIFDNTLRVTLYSNLIDRRASIYEDSSPLLKESWTEVKTNSKGTMHYFEYEFTNWHYQKALEANGYDID